MTTSPPPSDVDAVRPRRSVDVVLPCLNEADALPWVLARVPAGWRALVASASAAAPAGVKGGVSRVFTRPGLAALAPRTRFAAEPARLRAVSGR